MFFFDALVATSISVSFYIVARILFARFLKQQPFNFFQKSDFIATTVFAVIVFSINYFWVDSATQESKLKVEQQSISSGQSFTAPQLSAVQKPLLLDVDFEQEKKSEEVVTEIITKLAKYRFSSYSASLQSMELLWQEGQKLVPVVGSCIPSLAIGLSAKTPYNYELVSLEKSSDDSAYVLKYEARLQDGFIHKTFIIYNDTYQIDIKFSLDQKDSDNEVARLFISSPVLGEDIKAIVNKSGIVSDLKIQDIVLSKEQPFKEFWFEPKVFGFVSKFLATICFDSKDGAISRAYLKKNDEVQYQAILESKLLESGKEISWSLYVGPKTVEGLGSVSKKLTVLMQYGWLTFIAKPMMQALVYIKEKTGNYGIAIILLTLLLKLLLLPFTLKGERSMKKQAEFEKKRQYLQQKFKNDKAAYEQAMAELINKQGFPMLSGCLPMLLNIPVFLSLNKILSSSIELHGAKFAWLPDLSSSDPYYILSIIVFVAMAIAPNMGNDPRQWASRFGFALLIGAVSAYLASGLALFIAVNTLATVAQSYIVRLFDK
ncbi:YidC/Oxa1 family insertase periplasmic-domain containing protein [Candidatus Dependentiae bacterium]|nr:YidC/Oxa1 family insertase periplasmic-domain containing protein [Candidatus Dependentiae bacterium]